MDLGHLSVEVRADLRSLENGLKRAETMVKDFGRTPIVTGAVKGTKEINGFTGAISKSNKEMDKLGKRMEIFETAGQKIYEPGLRQKQTKTISTMYDPYTKKLAEKYANIPRINPSTIQSFEKFNMAGELTNVRLKAVEKSGKNVSESFKIAAGKTGRWASPLGKLNEGLNSLRWTMVNVMFATMALGAVASPFIMATKWAMEYEVALKRISAVTGTTVTEVRADILSLRRDAPFAIKEVSDAYLAFTKAGFSAAEATKAVPSILKLSISGFIDLAEAGKITAQILHQFSLEASEAGRVADVLANAANISAADVQDFGTAMAYVGPTAVSAGLELEELAGALTILSNAGLKGSRMGTNLRQALSDIIEPSKEAEVLMKKMGISFYTASGKMKSLDSIVTTLRVSLSFLETEEEKLKMLGEIFDIRGLTAINSFIKQAEDGKGTIAGYTEAVKEIGYANKVAAIQMEASTNQLKIFIENLKTDMITGFGESFNETFGNILKTLNKYNTERKKMKAMEEIGLVNAQPDAENRAIIMKTMIESFPVLKIPISIAAKITGTSITEIESEVLKIKDMIAKSEKMGIEADLIFNIRDELDKWNKLKDELKEQGRIEVSLAYETGESNLRNALKEINEKLNKATPEEALKLGELLSKSYDKQVSAITEVIKKEHERYAAMNSILALYDEENKKLSYTAAQLGITEKKYDGILEKVKKIKNLEVLIEIRTAAKLKTDDLETELIKLKADLSKTDFFVMVKAKSDTDMLVLTIEKIENKMKNLGEVSRIGMLTGQMKEFEKAKILIEGFVDDLNLIKSAELGYTGISEKITELERYGMEMEANVISTEALKTAEENLQNQIRNMRDELSLANKTLSNHKDALSSVNSEISKLSGQRFTGETEFLRLISEQNKYLDEQRLAELGVYDAQTFINNALKKTSDGYSGLVKSMEKVNQVAESSKNTYDSWKTTVEEFIKASITSGESLGADVTSEVKKFQTMLLGVTDMSGAEKGTTEAEQNLERLKLAYDYYYGGMRQDVKFATIEHEDSVNGIASSSETVINALKSQWSEQFKLNNLISESGSYVDTLNGFLEDEQSSLQNVTDEITKLTKEFDGMNRKIYESIAAYVELNKVKETKTEYSIGQISPDMTTPLSSMTPEEAEKKGYSYSGAVGWHKSDKQVGNISVTVNVSTDSNPEEIAREVKRELMSL